MTYCTTYELERLEQVEEQLSHLETEVRRFLVLGFFLALITLASEFHR